MCGPIIATPVNEDLLVRSSLLKFKLYCLHWVLFGEKCGTEYSNKKSNISYILITNVSAASFPNMLAFYVQGTA